MEEIRIEDYYDWAISIADGIYRKLGERAIYVDKDDLRQESLLALVEAKRSFVPQKGVKFTTYAYYRVKGAVQDFLRKQDYLPQEKRKKLKEYEQAKEKLLQQFEKEPIRKEMAKKMGISEEEVKEIEKLKLTFVSIDKPYITDDGDEISPKETIRSDYPTPEDTSIRQAIAKDIDEGLKTLSEEEREIFTQREFYERTLEEVARLLNMSTSTVHRKEIEIKRKLREFLEAKGWSIEDL